MLSSGFFFQRLIQKQLTCSAASRPSPPRCRRLQWPRCAESPLVRTASMARRAEQQRPGGRLKSPSRRGVRSDSSRGERGALAAAATTRANALQTCATALWLTPPRGPAAGAVLIPSLLPSIGRRSLPRREDRRAESGRPAYCIPSSLHLTSLAGVPPLGGEGPKPTLLWRGARSRSA